MKPSKAKRPAEAAGPVENNRAMPPENVRVRVLKPLAENGTVYYPGDEFGTTRERASSLGKLVLILALTLLLVPQLLAQNQWTGTDGSHSYPNVTSRYPTPTTWFSPTTLGQIVTSGGMDVVKTNAVKVDITTSYSIGDTWSDIIVVTNAFRVNGGSGVLQSFGLLINEDQAPPVNVLVFSRPFTVGATNAAWAVPTSEMLYCLGHFPVAATDYIDLGTNQIAIVRNLSIPVINSYTNRHLYLGIISTNALTMTNATQFSFTGVYQD